MKRSKEVLKREEEETKEVWKTKREHEDEWEGRREQRVSSWRNFMNAGKGKKEETRHAKLKTEDPNKAHDPRPVKRVIRVKGILNEV
ncbi:hypothetical protein L6164_018893 [Bauhinia variegata]|uniref:Uncharacterized protein n=1 Tax=Bauhinia variegata TaxID=167791 RepID=A0ACB9NE12_BAUVA|nr:hypothetical protein L6164_018893 [Bauhinia variegata]